MKLFKWMDVYSHTYVQFATQLYTRYSVLLLCSRQRYWDQIKTAPLFFLLAQKQMLKEKRKKKDESLSASPADPLGLVFRRHDDHWDRLQRAQRLQTSNEAMSQSHIRLLLELITTTAN